MPTFEVFIPAKSDADMNVTLTLDAPNWLGALRTGLVNLGEDPQAVANIMCDIQSDNSIHVTDLISGRVFRLREMDAEAVAMESADKTLPSLPVMDTEPELERPAPATVEIPVEPDIVEDVAAASTVDDKTVPIAPASAPMQPPAERFRPAPEPLTRTEARPAPSDPKIGRRSEPIDLDDVLVEIFERCQDLYDGQLNPDRIVNVLLDLAMEKIPSGAGSFYVADISGHDLQFAAVRGPKAKEILESGIRIAMGQGIAGFCAHEGVALAIGDVQRDPRFAREISEKIGYEAQSMICVPLEKEGRCYGAIQLINRSDATAYKRAELDILAAVANQAVELLAQVQV